jgi:1-acyl-sn-glycerol-3-phosphate acyltransferase
MKTSSSIIQDNSYKPRLGIRSIFGSILSWILLCAALPIFYVLVILFFWVSARSKHKLLTSWGLMYLLCTRYLCGVKYKIQGLENFGKSPAIIASNHQSMWETFAFSVFFPQHVWILKQELVKLPFFGWCLQYASPIAIDRKNGREALQQISVQGRERLKTGFWILVFPEGTRIKPKVDHNYKTGIAKLAQSLNLQIVPVAHNAGYAMPKHSFWVYPGTVEIRVGKPIIPKPEESPEQLTERIKKSITGELEQIYKTPYNRYSI